MHLVLLGLPFAMQLAMLCYLDSLLTSLVMDKLSGEPTRQNKELAAQGVATGLVAFLGGIPGAQATIRSVLILNEKATMRLAGIMVGIFVLIEMIVFQDMINLIPQAVFAGILFKVGYDVFDWLPLKIYARHMFQDPRAPRHVGSGEPATVGGAEIAFIAGTTAVTVFWDLNAAVILFGLLFYTVRKKWPIPDLEPVGESRAIEDED